jgi:7-carboxy-7-deazaguanine synthase
MMLPIVQRCITLGGEAPIGGMPVYLVRFSGCNLACTYCDTPELREVNATLSEDELHDDIARTIKQYPYLKVLFTGGEPLFHKRQAVLVAIMSRLSDISFYIETNGSIDIKNTSLPHSHYICDIKTPSSGHEDSFLQDNLRKLRPDNDCIKFVVDSFDLLWVKEKLKNIQLTNPLLPVYISPVWGKIEPRTLASFILENRLQASLSLQLHKIIWEDSTRR